MSKFNLKENSLLFAPMEGITDAHYRMAIYRCFPEWDLFSTDFLRAPTESRFPISKVKSHFGNEIFEIDELKNKTIYQILTILKGQTEFTVKQIEGLGFQHIDLNIGCPSRTVNSHGGGSYLLSDLSALKTIIQTIRKNFDHTFTVKMRVGYRDDKNFIEALKMIEGEGVEAITLHARTRDEMYKGVANWDYLKTASDILTIPLIANGDIWTLKDIQKVKAFTGCHSFMIARGAMKTPWLAKLYREFEHNLDEATDDVLLQRRKEYLPIYFKTLEEEYRKKTSEDLVILKRFKAFSRYLFDDFEDGSKLKSTLLRLKSLEDFKEAISRLH